MTHSTRRLVGLALLAAVLAVVAAACGNDSNTAGSGSSTTAAKAKLAGLTGSITGGGSSFQDAFEQRAIADFQKVAPKANVVYQKSGSSDGKKALADGTVDFAGSDSTIKDDEPLAAKKSEVLYFPIVAGPITVSYNIKGVDALRLSPETIAKIFQAQVTTWNDPAIRADNPGAALPATPITVVHRSDGSGTTSNFTEFLVAAAPGTWTLGAGDTVDWPARTQGAEKNSGVATVITQTDGAIGYVDLADAAKSNLDVAAVKNKAGAFVKPTPAGATAAVEGAAVGSDLTYAPTWAGGTAAYPITSPTYILVSKTQKSAETAKLLKAFLRFVLTNEQSIATEVLYAPLPKSLAARALTQIDQITGP